MVPADQLTDETRKWALELAQYSRFTLGLGKQAFYEQIELDEGSAYDYAKEIIAMNCLAGRCSGRHERLSGKAYRPF